jgi:uncharacterized protein (DUF1684 family)
MRKVTIRRSLASIAVFWAGAYAANVDNAYRAQIQHWRQQHEDALKADGGWLTVTGLFWLKDGINTIGSGPDNDIVLPASAPARLGVVRVENGTASPDVLSFGPLDLLLLKRGGRLALRLKDKDSVLRKSFSHLSWYPIQEDWKITAKFVPLPAGTKLVFDTVIGEREAMPSPGYVDFQHNGETYKLQAAAEDNQLFLVFRDLTSGKSTYPASRFLYADLPGKDGTVVLDFNKAESPPCAFTPYVTCPLPPPGNRLKLAIEAGEQYLGH